MSTHHNPVTESATEMQAEPGGKGGAYIAGAAWVAFGLLFIAALYVRCAGLTGRGIDMQEPDTWKYLQVASDWTQGKYTWMEDGAFYRPAIHLIHACVWRVFGVNHYAIKFANVTFDACILLLIFLIARSLARNAWAGVAAALLYAFVPNVIRNIMIEQHYSPATCLVLLAVGFAIWSQRTRRHGALELPLLGLGGFALGAAVNMHADLALLTPGLLFGIAWVALAHKPANPCDKVIANIAVFLAGIACVYGIGIVVFGTREVVNVLSREFFTVTHIYGVKSDSLGYLGSLKRILHESFSGMLQQRLFLLYAFLGAVMLALFLPLCRRLFPRLRRVDVGYGEPGIVLLPVLSYGLLYALLIGWFKSWLLFYPLYPLVLISVVCWYHRFFSAFLGSRAVWATVAGALLVAWHNPHVTPRTAHAVPDRLMPAYEFLRDRVNEQSRVLVLPTADPHAPFSAYHATAGLASPVYLGASAVYVTTVQDFPLPYTAESLRRVCLSNHVRYILSLRYKPWLTWIDESLKLFPQFQIVGDWKPYSYGNEQELMQQLLASVGATKLRNIENGLFELPSASSQAMNTAIDAPVAPFTPEVLHTKEMWDFRNLESQSFAWLFPGMVQRKTPYGAISTVAYAKPAHICLRNVRVPADSINGVWIEAMLDDKASKGLELYPLPPDTDALFMWAREGDYQPGEFPYAMTRRTALGRVNSKEPFLFVTTLKDRSPLWAGDITDMAIRFVVKSGPISGNEAHLIVPRIGFF